MPRTSILDDPERIKKIDRSDMLSFCVNAPEHYGNAVELAKKLKIDYPRPQAIIVAGMGGSGIGGELLKDWCRQKVSVPIETCNDYKLPRFADKNTLVFIVSYSGETEETLSSFLEAIRKECMIICISSGGTLHEIAQKLSLPNLLVPVGMAPRATLPYLFMPMPATLDKLGLVSDISNEYSEAIRVLREISTENSPRQPVKNNFSKSLASDLLGTVPAIYGFGLYRAVAQRFKTQFNENSKNLAKWEIFPELNHNEIVGWEVAQEFAKFFSVIFIRDANETIEIRNRIETTKKLIMQDKLRSYEVWSRGESDIAKMVSLICTGDFISVYLALLRGINPTPVEAITVLKRQLKRTGIRARIIRELHKATK